MSPYRNAVRLGDAAARLGRSQRQVLRLVARGVLRRIGPGRRGGTWINAADLAAYSRRTPSRREVARWQLATRATALETLLLVRAARGGKYDSEGLELAEFVQTEFRPRRKAFGRFARLIHGSPAAQYARESVAEARRREIGAEVQRAAVSLTSRQLEYLLAVVAVSFAPASKVRDRRDDPEAFLADAVEASIRPSHLAALGREMGAEQTARDVVRYDLRRLFSLPDEALARVSPLTAQGLIAARRAIDAAKASAGWRRFTGRMADESLGAKRPRLADIARTLGRSVWAAQDMGRRVAARLDGRFAGIDLARIAKVKRPKVRPAVKARAWKSKPEKNAKRPPMAESPELSDADYIAGMFADQRYEADKPER